VVPRRRLLYTVSAPAVQAPLRYRTATYDTRSVLVVSHHLDGLLHSVAVCLATHCQPGFASFPQRLTALKGEPSKTPSRSFPDTHTPPEELHLPVAVPHHCGPYPLVVTARRTSPQHLRALDDIPLHVRADTRKYRPLNHSNTTRSKLQVTLKYFTESPIQPL